MKQMRLDFDGEYVAVVRIHYPKNRIHSGPKLAMFYSSDPDEIAKFIFEWNSGEYKSPYYMELVCSNAPKL